MSLGAPDLHRQPPERPALELDHAPLLKFVADALRQLMQGDAQPVAFITIPAPVARIDAMAALNERAMLWDPPTGPGYAGTGHAVTITTAGSERIADIAAAADQVWARIAQRTYPGTEPMQPRFFGGMAFSTGSAATTPWRDFGDARFVMPTLLYTREGGRARLSLTVDTSDAAQRRIPHIAAELQRVLSRLSRAQGPASVPARSNPTVVAMTDTAQSLWRQQIEDIRAAIADQRCDKIVAARCRVIELSQTIDTAGALDALAHSYPDCYRFAYQFGGAATFVGATPERLITRTGDRISTQALAGSIAAGNGIDKDGAARALLASGKDRSEQDFVVQTIQSVLGPLCSELRVPTAPVIRELRHVLHLETPISGTLAQPVHILQLVAALHPTPAVGGVPTALATSWIAEREPTARGWYAAPVGWFDNHGQGEFAVAIRSGLLDGTTAHVYAGAGIVRDSDPDAEYAETKLKQRPLLSALGIDP